MTLPGSIPTINRVHIVNIGKVSLYKQCFCHSNLPTTGTKDVLFPHSSPSPPPPPFYGRHNLVMFGTYVLECGIESFGSVRNRFGLQEGVGISIFATKEQRNGTVQKRGCCVSFDFPLISSSGALLAYFHFSLSERNPWPAMFSPLVSSCSFTLSLLQYLNK